MPLRIGAKLPHTGAISAAQVPDAAIALEQAGFDSIWVSDHVVLPERMDSHYPFAADGRATWPTDTPYLEALTVLAAAAAVTSRVRLGTAVLVVPQRNPVLTGKQLATIAALSEGRLDVGVGAGWLREEFDALHAPFAARGAALEAWVEIFREIWTGELGRRGEPYSVPAPVRSLAGRRFADSGIGRRSFAAGAGARRSMGRRVAGPAGRARPRSIGPGPRNRRHRSGRDRRRARSRGACVTCCDWWSPRGGTSSWRPGCRS